MLIDENAELVAFAELRCCPALAPLDAITVIAALAVLFAATVELRTADWVEPRSENMMEVSASIVYTY